MAELVNKVAIVTGASSGIGYATAKLFAEAGAKVVVTARRRAELDALVAEIEEAGGDAVAVAGDVRDEALAEALVETAVGRFGGLDVAFNNAGSTGEMAPLTELSLAGWRDTVDTNLTSAFLGAKHQVPAMIARGGGSLIFTSTFVGYTVGFPGMAAYAASKAALIGLIQVIAAELGAKGIRANAILPGGTDTPMNVANAPGAAPGDPRVRGGPARPQTHCGARGDRAVGPLPRVRRFELHHGRGASGRRRGLHQSNLSPCRLTRAASASANVSRIAPWSAAPGEQSRARPPDRSGDALSRFESKDRSACGPALPTLSAERRPLGRSKREERHDGFHGDQNASAASRAILRHQRCEVGCGPTP